MSRLRNALVAIGTAALLACVVPLKDRNAPIPNGGVTGPAADCTQVSPLGRGGPSGDPGVRLVGRFDTTDPKRPKFDWSGNEIRARFEGTELRAGFTAFNTILFTATLDDLPPKRFPVLEFQTGYDLAGSAPNSLFGPLSPGPHEIVIHRDSEALFGALTFEGFDFGPGGQALPPTRRDRRIEIIGDSITCGYGNLGSNATCPFSVDTENNFLAYGSLVGRALDAEVTSVAWSGKGIVLNYRENPNDVDSKTTVPQLWRDRTVGSLPDGPKWDFAKEEQPHVVVINLGTNDITRDIDEDNIADGLDFAAFRQGYFDFVTEVRGKRPDAHIFLALPPMITDQFPFQDARTDAGNAMRSIADEFAAKGDTKVYYFELVEQGTRYGLGCDYHPNLVVHRIMADQVAGAIRQKTCW